MKNTSLIWATAIIVLLNINLHSQEYLSWEKFSHLTLSASAGAFSGYADVNEQRKHNSTGETRIYYDKLAHNYQSLERLSFFSAGISIPLTSKMKPWHLASDMALTLVYQGIFHGFAANIARDKPLFWQSEYQKANNTSGFERFQSPAWILGSFVVVTTINIIIYEIL